MNIIIVLEKDLLLSPFRALKMWGFGCAIYIQPLRGCHVPIIGFQICRLLTAYCLLLPACCLLPTVNRLFSLMKKIFEIYKSHIYSRNDTLLLRIINCDDCTDEEYYSRSK